MIADLVRDSGQVAAAAGQIADWTGSESFRLNLTFQNTGGSAETLVLTLARAGGTARRVLRAVLATNEQLVVTGLAVDGDDTLYAATTNAGVVDYTAAVAPDDAPFSVQSFDASGALKQVNTGVGGNQTVGGNLAFGGTLTATPGASTAAAGTTTADAGVLPAATASIYPTTGANGTTGVRVHADDKVTGRKIYVGNGVSNAVLKVYAPSGGTINGAAADAAFSSASGKGVVLVCLNSSGNTWLAW